jgi:hypothetical protein
MVSLVAIPVTFLNVHLGSRLFVGIPLYDLSHRLIDRGSSDPGMKRE